MTRPIQTNRCTNTVARSFGIEATRTIEWHHELIEELKESGYSVEQVESRIKHDESKCNVEYDDDNKYGHFNCRIYDDMKMKSVIGQSWSKGIGLIIFTPGHVQAVHADGTITDTAFNRRGFMRRTVYSAYKIS